MKSLTPLNTELFQFSLVKHRKPTDLAHVKDLLQKGADPNLVVNGMHLLFYFISSNKYEVINHLLPLCDFSQRFTNGRSLLGEATVSLVNNLEQSNWGAVEKFGGLFREMIACGADPQSVCNTERISLRKPCVDILFDALLSAKEHPSSTGAFLLDLLHQRIYPQDEYWNINFEHHHMPAYFPLCFNRWWAEFKHVRQQIRIEHALDPIHTAISRTRKI